MENLSLALSRFIFCPLQSSQNDLASAGGMAARTVPVTAAAISRRRMACISDVLIIPRRRLT